MILHTVDQKDAQISKYIIMLELLHLMNLVNCTIFSIDKK